MDVQMPEMDGLEATKWLRAREPAAPRMRIIAMTANAMEGDRERCLAAGMDDYLAKPYRRDALRKVLERWVLDHVADDGAAAASEAPLATFDRRALDEMCPKQRPAASRIVAGLIDHYFLDAPNLIAALEQAAAASDPAALAHVAHLLSVDSEFVGARKLAALCSSLERAGLDGVTEQLEQQIATIRQEYEAVHRMMQTVRTGTN